MHERHGKTGDRRSSNGSTFHRDHFERRRKNSTIIRRSLNTIFSINQIVKNCASFLLRFVCQDIRGHPLGAQDIRFALFRLIEILQKLHNITNTRAINPLGTLTLNRAWVSTCSKRHSRKPRHHCDLLTAVS